MPVHSSLAHVRVIQKHDTSGILHQGAHVVLGDKELLNPLVAGIAGATLQVLPGAGQGLLSEIAEAFNRVVLNFMSRTRRRDDGPGALCRRWRKLSAGRATAEQTWTS